MIIKEYLLANPTVDAKTFGQFIRFRREQLGKTVRGFAGEIDMTPAYLSDIEKGNRYAPKNKLEELRKGLLIPEEEAGEFEDLASATRGFLYEDINPYLGKTPLASVALRKARDLDISVEQWQAFIEQMEADTKPED